MPNLPKTLFRAATPIVGIALPCLAFQAVSSMNLAMVASAPSTPSATFNSFDQAVCGDFYCSAMKSLASPASITASATLHATPQLANTHTDELAVGEWQGKSWSTDSIG